MVAINLSLTLFSGINGYPLLMLRSRCFPFYLSCLVLCLCVLHPAFAQPQPSRPAPSFEQCQKLASAKTSAQEKAELTKTFKTNGLFCSMLTAPFQVQHVFGAGSRTAQLRLQMGPSNRYGVDGKSLLDILLPDRAEMPIAQMMLLAGQLVSLLGDMFNANVDPMTVKHVSGKVGALASMVGINARAALMQIDALRGQMRLDEKAIDDSFWLGKLAHIPLADPAQRAQAAVPPAHPGWMQKLLGAGQNILGTLQPGRE